MRLITRIRMATQQLKYYFYTNIIASEKKPVRLASFWMNSVCLVAAQKRTPSTKQYIDPHKQTNDQYLSL